jgi:pyrroline-5-carboxylate reductase
MMLGIARSGDGMSRDQQIVLIGFGNMGQALARGWLATGYAPPSIRVVDPDEEKLALARELGLGAAPEFVRVLERGGGRIVDVIVIAVKPDQAAAAVGACAAALPDRAPVFLSIAAGKTLAQLAAPLAASLGADAAVVRAMPNTPAAIGRGMTALVASAAVSEAQKRLCSELMSAVGAIAWLDDEAHMDAVTAISGSGPAYVFLLIECLERAAVELGLDPALAAQLATATVAGAAAYAEEAGEPAARLRERVTSPKGTTYAALQHLLGEDGLAALMLRATRAAAERSRELARG